eukprot:9491219-Pyramimonas_sp.AAC.1
MAEDPQTQCIPNSMDTSHEIEARSTKPPRPHQNGPRRGPEDGPGRLQEAPKRPQEAPKRPPRGSHEAPRDREIGSTTSVLRASFQGGV